jgi:uncharacterized protein (TIGR03083 family)
VDVATYVAAIRQDGELFAGAVERAGLDAAVPSCPEWVVRDLVRHQGGVHRWAAGIVGLPHTEFWPADLPEVVGGWPDDRDTVVWFRDGVAGLTGVLEAAPSDLECWTFLRNDSPLRFWSRRQAHETAIHRVDAELAAGEREPTPFAPAFAADGIDELLTGFVVRSKTGLVADPARTLAIRPTDAEATWRVSIGPEGATTNGDGSVGEGIADADATVSGSASDLYLTLWSRRAPGGLAVGGDAAVLRMFLDRVHIRWA